MTCMVVYTTQGLSQVYNVIDTGLNLLQKDLISTQNNLCTFSSQKEEKNTVVLKEPYGAKWSLLSFSQKETPPLKPLNIFPKTVKGEMNFGSLEEVVRQFFRLK